MDDDISEELPLGFTFNFGGTDYTSVRIMSNGRLQFNNTFCGYGTQTTSPRTYPYPYANSNLSRTMRVYGADFDPSVSSSSAYVSYAQSGIAPNRIFTVTWVDIREWNSSSSRFNLQVILREGDDFIYQFGNIINSTGGKAQIGWQLSTSDYDLYAFSDVESLENSAIRFFKLRNLADWVMEGNFTDSSGNGYNGTAVNGVTTTYANDPAYVSSGQNTCQYAQLDTNTGGERRYIEIPSLSASLFNSSFTFGAWIRSGNVGASGQRILVNDDNGNGWALSLGDGGIGKVRLFNRNQSFSGATGGGSTSGVIFDSPAVFTNNQWYFVATVVDLYLRTVTLYVYSSSGNLLVNTSATFSNSAWCPTNRCTGAIAIGGETLASPEGVSPNFHFKGNIDEARLWQSVLPQASIAAELARSRPCSAVGGGVPGSFNTFETTTAAGSITGPIKTKIAGNAFSFDIIALNIAGTGVETGFTGNVAVDLVANTTTGVALGAGNCPVSGTTLAVGTRTITNGRSTVSFPAVSDAWRDVRVRIRYPTTSPTLTACSTDNFAMRPNALGVLATDGDWQTAGTTRTLNNTGASGGTVHKAGRPFTLTATGYNSASVITGNYAGQPSANITAYLLPASCATCALTVGAFAGSGGTVVSNTASYNEVGAFTLQLVDSGFASVDAADSSAAERNITSGNLNVGRFVPNHFDVAYNTPQFETACGSFGYLGQPFDYAVAPLLTATAKNFNGDTTIHYTGSLFKIAPATLTGQAYAAATGTLEAVAGSLPIPGVTDLGGGQGRVSFGVGDASAGGGLRFARGTTPLAPFDADIALSINVADSEGIAYASNPARFGQAVAGSGIAFNAGKIQRFGRLRLGNVHGSALRPLSMPIEAQYWNGNVFLRNTDDNCTALNPNQVALSGWASNMNACETAVSTGGTLASGAGRLSFAAPGSGNGGSVVATANLVAPPSGNTCLVVGGGSSAVLSSNLPWLQGKWSSAGNWDENPAARATFGVGAAPLIEFRERY